MIAIGSWSGILICYRVGADGRSFGSEGDSKGWHVGWELSIVAGLESLLGDGTHEIRRQVICCRVSIQW